MELWYYDGTDNKGTLAIRDTSTISSEQVLLWAKWVETQRSETAMLKTLKDHKAVVESHAKATKSKSC